MLSDGSVEALVELALSEMYGVTAEEKDVKKITGTTRKSVLYMNTCASVQTGRARFALQLILGNAHARSVPRRPNSYVTF